MAQLQNHSAAAAAIYRRIIELIAVPVSFAVLRVDGGIVALAYGAVHDGLLCYESVITDPNQRGRGFARSLLAALNDWAGAHGAKEVCLQVEASNAPARALYERLGLKRELYRYRYFRHSP